MSSFQPPPTWALPILVDETTQKAIFNPIWLKWFVDLSANLSSSGVPAGAMYRTGGVTVGHLVIWADIAGTLAADGGVLGSAAHSATSDFLGASATAAKAAQAASGFQSSDGSTGLNTTITTASLVGKTITVKDGLITGFA